MNKRLLKLIGLLTLVTLGCSSSLPFLATVTPTATTVPPTHTPTEAPTETNTPEPTATPEPTETPAPEATDTPEPATTPDPEIYLFDDYSDPADQEWRLDLVTDPDLEGFEYRDGRLFLYTRFTPEDNFGIVQATYFNLPDDFAATVDIEFGPGASTIGEAGIVFRVGVDLSDYEFTISLDGSFSIFKYADQFTPLVDYTFSEAIHADPRAVNQLTVLADGPNLSFLINGVLVAELVDAEIHGSDFGLVVYNWEDIGASAFFDNLLITSLSAYLESPPAAP